MLGRLRSEVLPLLDKVIATLEGKSPDEVVAPPAFPSAAGVNGVYKRLMTFRAELLPRLEKISKLVAKQEKEAPKVEAKAEPELLLKVDPKVEAEKKIRARKTTKV